MTVIATGQIFPRLWRGWDDPSLPVGMWVGQVQVTGDGSGGAMRMQHFFRPEADPVSGRFYNLEQVDLIITVNAPVGEVACALGTDGFDRVGGAEMFDRGWTLQVGPNSRAGESVGIYNEFTKLPIFLGQASTVPDGACSLSVEIANVDTAVFQSVLQGYIWDPRSVSAQGGLRRPLGNLYG